MEKLLAAVAQTHGFDDDDEPVVSTPPEVRLENSVSSPVIRGETSGSRLIGEVSDDVRPSRVGGELLPAPASASPAVGQVIGDGEKRKRGRPSKGQLAANPPPPKKKKIEEEGEDVCFICFDGGSLTLCDRKGCPKAYHPVCIKRDEEFFKTKAKWFCGWHICRTCQKTSHYMCYTCTYALCKGCIKDADFLCVRGNKGLCTTCMKTVMLFENKDQATNESAQVDFDDTTSFEHFFKTYWLALKDNLSLSLCEVMQAKNPCKGTTTGGGKPQLELNNPDALSNLMQNDGLSTHAEKNDKGGVVDKFTEETSEREPDNSGIGSRKRKIRKKSAHKAPQHGLNEYAAIDVHNINLVYLRRNLIKNLYDDQDNFNDKVFGSFVRIRISTNDQKSEVFRLVLVAGTSKAAEPYKFGDTTTDVMFEVLNLDKIEVVSLDAISNLEFTEDECRRLRQSIRCGLVQGLTVGDIRRKALALQSVRVNDLLEAEVLRLNHLRNQASEKGDMKELREYVDRLELLKSPEERQRRISELPEIHTDPKMNPLYKSEDNTSNGDNGEIDGHVRPSCSPYPRNRPRFISPNKKGKDGRSTKAQNKIIEKADPSGSNGLNKHLNLINIDSSATGGRNDQAMQMSGLETSTGTASTGKINIDSSATGGRDEQVMRMSGLETSTGAASMGNSPSADHIETEKLWHYRDPNGRIQGPFSMMQLRKWSTTGLFPPDMRIWTNHELFDSLLLSDALNGKLHGASDLLDKPPSGSREKEVTGEIVVSECADRTSRDHQQTEGPVSNSASVSSDKNTEHVTVDEPGSSGWPQCWDLLKDSNSSVDDVQARNLLPSSSSGKEDAALTDRVQESDELNHDSQNGENSMGLTQNPMTSEQEFHYQSSHKDLTGQPSEEKLSSVNIDLSSNDLVLDSGPVFPPVSESSKWAEKIECLDFPSPSPRTENQQPVLADIPEQDSGILELLSPAPRSHNEYQEGQATETKQPGLTMFPNPLPGWSCDSTLGIGTLKPPEVVNPWCGYSPAPANPSMQDWDSDLLSASSSKPPEVMSECIDTSVSDNQHLTHASTSQPAPDWLAIMNGPIEFVALGEDSVSDLLAEVDAMESRGTFPSPTSAMKFAREFLEDDDDCFSSIDEFSSANPQPIKSDAFSSTTDIHLTSQSSAPCKPTESSPLDALDSFRRSTVHSSASSEGETNAPVQSGDAASEFHPHAPNNPGQEMVHATTGPGPNGPGLDAADPGWGTVQGNINLVTVQGNVNLVVVGGPGQGMGNIGWVSNPGTAWTNPSASRSPRNGSLPWDGQWKYTGERYSPREWGGYQQGGGESGFGRGRPPWGRQPYGGGGGGGGGGYPRPLPKGQRVCKFYESGHCRKGAFCDYLHP
ncbi:hypothetical protein ACS0TY_030578 [Phlomoides rotata]